jgi:probable F420-dependent oxidoreductase
LSELHNGSSLTASARAGVRPKTRPSFSATKSYAQQRKEGAIVKIGAVYPQTGLGGDPAALRDVAVAVEALGYDYLLTYEHVLGVEHKGRSKPLRGPYTETDPFHDPFVAFGFLAGLTRRIELVTGIVCSPQRQTALLARQAADVELVSDGRLRLGLGAGWNHVEFEALGMPFEKRGAMLDEQIELLRRLWREPLIDYKGKFHRIDRAALLPRPKTDIPIYLGGFSEPALQRAARLADGFIFASGMENSRRPGIARLLQLLGENGRQADQFGLEALLQTAGGNGLSVADGIDEFRVWRDLGGTHAAIVTTNLDYRTAAEHISHFAETIVRLRASGDVAPAP